jgi:DNA-binding response OmpR family regulator
MRRKILVVEDDIDLNSTIVKFLNLKNFEATKYTQYPYKYRDDKRTQPRA